MNDETLLYRQIHPGWIQQNRVTSQAFRPTPKDAQQLSVYDGDLITAEASWDHYTNIQGLVSDGVMAVAVAECRTHGLPVKSDPETFREHALIDFREFTRKQMATKAKLLSATANTRGWQYRPVG